MTVENSLRAGPDANPPLNMHRALIFSGAFALTSGVLVFLLRGKQTRRKLDEEMNKRQNEDMLLTTRQRPKAV